MQIYFYYHFFAAAVTNFPIFFLGKKFYQNFSFILCEAAGNLQQISDNDRESTAMASPKEKSFYFYF